jgi:hypothetical protein
MRKLIYKIIDGTTVNTFAEAKKSGLPYSVAFEDILTEKKALSAKRQELMDKFGFVPVVKRA